MGFRPSGSGSDRETSSAGAAAWSRSRATVVLALLVLVALGLRGYRLGAPALWVDEAESALNALTIVADGLPGATYLGQPLYENTLMRPWPGHPEYEFRDLSYSDRGLAVYHSWLPLYAIAAAFRVAGVSGADARLGPPAHQASLADLEYWTAVPRVPSLLFSAVLVVAAWALGRAVHGPAVAAGLALATATSNFFVYAGRQARYYSAALAFDAVCGLAIWQAWRRGRLRDHALAGLSIGVLFHAHSVSAVAMTAVYVACVPLGFRQPRLWLRLTTAGITAAVLIVPWAIWSGLLTQAVQQPPARDYLDAAMVLWSLPTTDPVAIATFLAGLAWFTAAYAGCGPESWRRPILDQTPALYFAACWLLLSYAVFVAVMPAASYFPFRLRLFVAVPGLLVIALVAATACRAVRPGWPFLPVAVLAGLLVFSRQLPPSLPGDFDPRFADLIQQIQRWTLRDGRIYASPNDHLVFTYYTGRPVQSVAAVRRAWLDAYPGDLVILEGVQYLRPNTIQAQEVARGAGVALSPADATIAAQDALMRATTVHLQASGLQPTALPSLPARASDQPLLELTRDLTRQAAAQSTRGTPLGRQSFATWEDYRTRFFFWFANPEQRAGPHLNYATCRTRARVTVHPSGHTVLDCRTRPVRPLLGPSEAREDVP